MIGSRIFGDARLKASLKDILVAVMNAIDEESTGCVWPSSRTYLQETTGNPVKGPFFTTSWNAFSIEGLYSFGTFVPIVAS